MKTLSCRNLTKDCLDTLSAADSTEIQKVYLNHVHAKHPLEWSHFSKQYKSVSLVTIRDRFLTQVETVVVKDVVVVAVAPQVLIELGDSVAPA